MPCDANSCTSSQTHPDSPNHSDWLLLQINIETLKPSLYMCQYCGITVAVLCAMWVTCCIRGRVSTRLKMNPDPSGSLCVSLKHVPAHHKHISQRSAFTLCSQSVCENNSSEIPLFVLSYSSVMYYLHHLCVTYFLCPIARICLVCVCVWDSILCVCVDI